MSTVPRIFNVKINANTPLKNVDISGNKNVNIIGLDDISGKINAKNLEITTPGNINLTTQVSDTFTAQGDKSVKVTQTSGDIKISKIASKGNVNLTAQNGAIVNSVDSAINMTGAADKISAWQAAGLISDKDSDNSATNSAQAEKSIRLEALENLFKRWALKDDGTIDQTIYNQFINNTADRTTLNAEQIIQMEIYQSLQKSTDYGFSKNQLLYAVQESLLNPNAGITASISDPIIIGKNITLTAKSLGKELSPVTYSDLTNLKTLKKLAGIKGGDVTFNDNGTVTVTAQSPITVAQSTAQDKLNITTQGNTFISGTANTKFNLNTPINAGDKKVVLMTGNGIDASKGISAKEIELYAGAGELNAKIISGTLTANALDDITINADTTLPIKNVTSNDYTIIKANGNIVASDKNSVIRSTDVELTATNNIGTKSLPLTIFSEVMLLNAKNVYVYDGDPSGGEEGEHSGKDSSKGGSSKGNSSSGGSSSGGSNNAYSNNYSSGYSNFASNPSSFLIPTSSFLINDSNFASNPSSFATLGTTYTRSSLGVSNELSFLIPNSTFLIDDRQTRNYFEVKFIPTWLEKEFMRIDFDYSFDHFGIKNATAEELTIDK